MCVPLHHAVLSDMLTQAGQLPPPYWRNAGGTIADRSAQMRSSAAWGRIRPGKASHPWRQRSAPARGVPTIPASNAFPSPSQAQSDVTQRRVSRAWVSWKSWPHVHSAAYQMASMFTTCMSDRRPAPCRRGRRSASTMHTLFHAVQDVLLTKCSGSFPMRLVLKCAT